jgi:hypothetical protein
MIAIPRADEPARRQSAGAVAGSVEKLDEQLRVSVEALLHPSSPPKPVEEMDDLLLAISHHLDKEASERKAIYNRLRAIDNEMERLASRGFARYLIALFIGVAVILAWTYGEAAKQTIATRAPELGWSPQTKQMIAGWMQQLGWTKPLAVDSKAASLTQSVPELAAPKAPATLSLDPEQMQQLTRSLITLQQTVEQLAAGQDQTALEMRREMARLESDLVNILVKIPEPPPQRRGRR